MNKRSILFYTFILSGLFAHSSCEGNIFYGEISDNFITRWAFQDFCDFVFDPRTSLWAHPTSTEPGGVRFKPDEVDPGALIFVRDIELFFKEMHPHIKNPYVIVTHGEYRDTCREYYLDYLDDEKVIAWFSIHPTKYGHEKYHPLPLGINQNKKLYQDTAEFNMYLKEVRENTPKSKLVYMNFDDNQNPERQILKKILSTKNICTNSTPVPFRDYLKEMAEYKFALSPRGWGPDCYRTWEALYVGTIPIVRRCQFDTLIVRDFYMGNIDQPDFTDTYNLVPRASRSQLDSLYEDLPILVIDDWQELTEEFLEEKYGEITSRTYDIAKLYMEYWQRKIIQVRDNFLCKKSFQNDTLSIKKTKVYKDVELDHDQVEAHKVLKQIIDSDFLDKTFLDKLDFQTTPIQKIKSQGDINYYLLKCAYEQNEFLIDYYHLHDEPGEVVVIVQTDHTGKILSKIAIHIATTIIIDAQQEKIAYIANFLVKDEYCGLGYGGKLFKEAMTLIESYNAERAILKVKGGGSNHPALKIYERYGFQHDPKSPTEKYLMYKVLKAHN